MKLSMRHNMRSHENTAIFMPVAGIKMEPHKISEDRLLDLNKLNVGILTHAHDIIGTNSTQIGKTMGCRS